MNIKVQCVCGTRYSFDVEPQNGVMPFRVNCPTCNADGTDAANQIIAESLPAAPPAEPPQPRLRMQTSAAAAPAELAPAAAASPVRAPAPAPGAGMRRYQAEARKMRMVLWAFGAVFLLLLAGAGAWAWYAFVGSKPHMVYSVKIPSAQGDSRMALLPGGKVLLASADSVTARDLHNGQDVWSATIPHNGETRPGPPELFIDKDSVWVCPGDQVVRLDIHTGQIKATIPITGRLVNFMPAGSGLLVVSATDETGRIVVKVDLATGETSSQTIEVPRAEKHAMPDELPPNVQPTADVLLAQATEDQKFNKPLNAISSQFFAAGQNLVELRVKLLEPKVTWVQSIKPRGPSLINGNTTASTPAGAVEEEVFNDIKRDKTGGVKPIDESLYEVRLRRWLNDKPVEWKGKVNGVPRFFALPTVDLLTAGKSLAVFDKQNNKLFDAPLSYPIPDRFTNDYAGAPAVERSGVLYFFDKAVLTAFGLPDGQVKWRLTSVGIKRVQFDDQGALYVDSTAANPEDIQYSDQIKFEKTPPVILKVEAQSGKILWQVQKTGQRTYLSGKYLYTSSMEGGGGMTAGLADAVHAPQQDGPVYFRIYRLNPQTGETLWEFYKEQVPDEKAFDGNWFVLRFGDELEGWKFLDF